MGDNNAQPAVPWRYRPRARAFVGNRNEVNSIKEKSKLTGNKTEEVKEQPLAADGRPIRPLRDSIGYDPLTDEWHFRARKSSSTSTGSNRKSTGDEYTFADDLRARKDSLGKVNAIKEEAPTVQPVLPASVTEPESITIPLNLQQENSTLNCPGDADKIRKDSESSSIEEVQCIAVEDPSVSNEYPFDKLPKEVKMELPSRIPITNKGVEEEKQLSENEESIESMHDHLSENQYPHPPVQAVQINCTGTLVCDRLCRVSQMDELNDFDTRHPPCLCTVHIHNAGKFLTPGVAYTYQTDAILIAKNSKCKVGYKVKILVQVSCGYLSLAIVITEGDPGRHLPWPFNKTVLFGLENIDRGSNLERGFKCYGNGENFKECLGRPHSADNTPIGIRRFIPVQALRNGFITGNTLVVHCLIFNFDLDLKTQARHFSSASFLNKKCLISSQAINVA